jgi:hypothetical protein
LLRLGGDAEQCRLIAESRAKVNADRQTVVISMPLRPLHPAAQRTRDARD